MVVDCGKKDEAGRSSLGQVARRVSLSVAALLVAFVAMTYASTATAHDARPLSVDITWKSSGLYLARLRVPPTVEADNSPTLLWPDNCRVRQQESRQDALVPSETFLVSCAGGLEGRRVEVRYPLYNPSLSTLFRFTAATGAPLMQVLTPDRLAWEIPRELSRGEVALGYVRLGVEHIWVGWDHLLFVVGLLLLAQTARRVLLTVTGFTLAHSLMLSLSALGLVRLPLIPVEAVIALSILFLAREIACPATASLARRFPILVSSTFGLLHGFGFAAALGEIGLPPGELVTGLVSFNLGVEIGQLVFIACLVGVATTVRSVLMRVSPGTALRQGRVNALGAHVMGIAASFWFFQRLEGFF